MTHQFDDERKGSTLTGRQKAILVVGAVLLVLLVVFIFSNTETEEVSLLAWDFDIPLWLALLIAAVAGALLWPVLRGLVRRLLEEDASR